MEPEKEVEEIPGVEIDGEKFEMLLEHGELVEDYSEDIRSHNYLLLNYGKNNRPIHIVCSSKEEYFRLSS